MPAPPLLALLPRLPCRPRSRYKLLANRAFCSLLTTVAELTKIPSPDPIFSPYAVGCIDYGARLENISHLQRRGQAAPAKPTESTRTGSTSRITASVARRAASAPIPPHIRAALSDHFQKDDSAGRPARSSAPSSFGPAGRTSRSMAAIIAILVLTCLDIAIRPEPLHRPPQRAIHWNRPPAQLALRFR